MLLEDFLAGRRSSADVTCDEVLNVISEKLEQQKQALAHKRTSALWLQYMKMTDILKSSIKAKRTGNFDLHLQSVQEMLPFLAAAAHNNYTKSVLLYLQQMLELQTTH